MENIAGWHGKPPSIDEMWDALKQIGVAEVVAGIIAASRVSNKDYVGEILPDYSRD